MPRSRDCLINIHLAIALRALIRAMNVEVPEGDIGLCCPECGKPVSPHQEGGGREAHFEHLEVNPGCSRSCLYKKTSVLRHE
jgi:hypothetical protein